MSLPRRFSTLPILFSRRLPSSSLPLHRTLHKGVDSTPPLRYTSDIEKSRFLLSSSTSSSLFSFSQLRSFSIPIASYQQDHRAMSITLDESKKSEDPVTKVGAVIADANTLEIVGRGHNRAPTGMETTMPWGKDKSNPLADKHTFVVHAEEAVLFQPSVRFDPVSAVGSGPHRLYTTLFPCNACAKIIAEWGTIIEVALYLSIVVAFLSYPTSVIMRLNDLRTLPPNELSPDVQAQIDKMRLLKTKVAPCPIDGQIHDGNKKGN